VVLPDGRVLVTGGYDERARRQVGIAEFYNPYTEAWTDAADARFPAGRSATILLDGRVLVVLADPSSRDLQTAFYDPGMASWAAGPDLPERFGGQTSVLLQDGRVLFAGGDVPNGPGANGSAHAALFDPVTGSWRLAAPMPVAPLGQTATVLPDGRVLATGGKEYGGPEAVHFSNAELYDPVTGTWMAIDAMAVARDGHTATLLPDGRVLIAGGEARGGASIDVAELYQPGDIR
jgi:hypothetical protein